MRHRRKTPLVCWGRALKMSGTTGKELTHFWMSSSVGLSRLCCISGHIQRSFSPFGNQTNQLCLVFSRSGLPSRSFFPMSSSSSISSSSSDSDVQQPDFHGELNFQTDAVERGLASKGHIYAVVDSTTGGFKEFIGNQNATIK